MRGVWEAAHLSIWVMWLAWDRQWGVWGLVAGMPVWPRLLDTQTQHALQDGNGCTNTQPTAKGLCVYAQGFIEPCTLLGYRAYSVRNGKVL